MSRAGVWVAIDGSSLEAGGAARLAESWRARGFEVISGPVGAGSGGVGQGSVARRVNELCRGAVRDGAGGVLLIDGPFEPAAGLEAASLLAALERAGESRGVGGGGGVVAPEAPIAGAPGDLTGLLIGRELIEGLYGGTGPLFEGYRRRWLGAELIWLAHGMGRLERSGVVALRASGAVKAAGPVREDAASVERDLERDTQLFMARAAHGFPGHEGARGASGFDRARFESSYDKSAERFWAARFGGVWRVTHAEGLMHEALRECARLGQKRVAIYGAGHHTVRVGAALASPAVEIAAIIDDSPSMSGKRMWNIPVMSRSAAVALGLDAIVISSDTIEHILAQACEPLRARGIDIVRLYDAKRAKRPGAGGAGGAGDGSDGASRGLTVLFHPAFDSAGALSDQFWRAAWYLAPIADRIGRIVAPYTTAQAPEVGAPASFLDPSVREGARAIEARLERVPVEERRTLRLAEEEADFVLQWRGEKGQDELTLARAQAGRPALRSKLYRVDPTTEQHEGDAWLCATSDWAGDQRGLMESSRAALAEFLARPLAARAYVFGTGPSLSAAMGHDFSDGVSIACNSMVKNRALMEKLRPAAVCAADPIFHAGCSAYAGEFRAHLTRAMKEHGCFLFVPSRDYALYRHVLESSLRGRIIGVPGAAGDGPNLDLAARFELTPTANILTFMLLPLACTIAQRIGVMGCDGRPMNENRYFWSHDKASQINEQMSEIQRAHPAFFAIDYDEYYLRHCRTLEAWIAAAEKSGKVVENLTPSHIPALASRSGPGVRAAA